MVPAEEWVELANGCLCCSVKSDFVAALEGLMLKRDKFDYILIETTGPSAAHGLAHPAKLSAVVYITQCVVYITQCVVYITQCSCIHHTAPGYQLYLQACMQQILVYHQINSRQIAAAICVQGWQTQVRLLQPYGQMMS